MEVQESRRVRRFMNCRLLRDHRIVEEDLWVRGGKIIDPQARFWEARGASRALHEAPATFVAPPPRR
jgi:N-acetylglucosamine-6-phosphate deacetylase